MQKPFYSEFAFALFLSMQGDCFSMLRMRIALCLVALLLLTNVTAAQEEDILLLPFLEDGEAVEGELTPQYDSHLYAFSATEGDVVTISVTQEEGSTLDPYVLLLGNYGQIYAADDDSGEVTFSSQISDFEIPATNTYFVLVTTFLGTSFPMTEDNTTVPEGQTLDDVVLPYTVLLEGNTNELGEEENFQYGSGDVTIGETVSLGLTPAEPIFYVDLDVTEAGNYAFTLTSDPLDPLIMVFDGEGRRIAINDDDDGLNAGIQGLALEPGRYLIMATVAGYDNIPEDTSFEGGEVELLVSGPTGSSK
jgi:hypothetical protein